MTKNNNHFYYSDFYLNTWYPNSFSMYAGVSSPPLDIPTNNLFTSKTDLVYDVKNKGIPITSINARLVYKTSKVLMVLILWPNFKNLIILDQILSFCKHTFSCLL